MTRILCVIGTRPEAIKMAPVVRALLRHPESATTKVCTTGQHREMLQQALDLFEIHADFELDVMEADQSLSRLTARLLEHLDAMLSSWRPDWVLAQGDTSTVLVAALTAFYHGCRFGHVEAGLRTGDKRRPFPEEVNRRMVAAMADMHFAPTPRARDALLREGVPAGSILVTGNTIVDAVTEIAARPYSWAEGPLASLPHEAPLVLITAHRRESFGAPFRDLCNAIRQLAGRFGPDGWHFVYPVHLNPNVQSPVREILEGVDHVSLIDPLDYASMVQLMRRARLILTDSGGIQEEAPSLGVPVLVMRDTTERPEGVEAGLVRLVGTDRERIVSEAAAALGQADARGFASGHRGANPYGDGRAGERIAAAILGGGP